MSLVATISKVSTNTNQEGLYTIVLKLVLTDTGGVGFTKEYSNEYRTGENIANKKQFYIKLMQKDIDRYKAGQVVLNSSQLDTTVTDIKSSLTL